MKWYIKVKSLVCEMGKKNTAQGHQLFPEAPLTLLNLNLKRSGRVEI